MSRQLSRNGFVCVVLIAAFSASSLSAQGQRPADNVTSEQAIACIQTAVASNPGRIEGIDIDVKAGKVLCEVEIIGANGRKMELHIDVNTNKVVESRPD